jgi:hypothetical protein
MTSDRNIHPNFRAPVVLAAMLALAGPARANEDARAAAANDPEYTAGYSTVVHGGAPTPRCDDRGYATREEFVKCRSRRRRTRAAPARVPSRPPRP